MLIKLKNPVEADGQRIETLSMRPPLVMDVIAARKASKEEMEQDAHLYARCCGQPFEVINRLHMADFAQLDVAYNRMVMEEAAAVPPGESDPAPGDLPAT
jgi:hypothetical protein